MARCSCGLNGPARLTWERWGVLGIDDFAFKKGHTYGMVLVDLERRRVVDLLPGRSQESLVAWLRRHPEVEAAARDRSNIYREALAKGAPEAQPSLTAKSPDRNG